MKKHEQYAITDGVDWLQGTVSKDGGKSSFEKRQEKLKEKIKSLEEEAVFVKPWQLGGEISAMKRPENSLLEEFLQFDHVMRQPPVITEEVSRKLEDVILQRVKDKAWDDVERKAKPKNTDPYEFKKKLILDEAKSKKSLSQIYEQVSRTTVFRVDFLKELFQTAQFEALGTKCHSSARFGCWVKKQRRWGLLSYFSTNHPQQSTACIFERSACSSTHRTV